MATGLLGSGTLYNSNRTTSTIYTVPSSGVSYAVVHITIAQEPEDGDGDHQWVTVAGHKVLTLLPVGGFNSYHGKFGSNSVSMMLSPGNAVVLSVYRSEVSCTVSGYEVA